MCMSMCVLVKGPSYEKLVFFYIVQETPTEIALVYLIDLVSTGEAAYPAITSMGSQGSKSPLSICLA